MHYGGDNALQFAMAHYRYVSVYWMATGCMILMSPFLASHPSTPLHSMLVVEPDPCGAQYFAPPILFRIELRPISWSILEAIDDLLPFDDAGRPIGISSGRKPVPWPALIEKAVCPHHAHLTY